MNPSSQSLLSLTPKAEFGCAKWVREVDSKGERGSLTSLGSLTERRDCWLKGEEKESLFVMFGFENLQNYPHFLILKQIAVSGPWIETLF